MPSRRGCELVTASSVLGADAAGVCAEAESEGKIVIANNSKRTGLQQRFISRRFPVMITEQKHHTHLHGTYDGAACLPSSGMTALAASLHRNFHGGLGTAVGVRSIQGVSRRGRGVTTTDVPLTAPTCGDTTKYDAPVTFQLSVTGWPLETVEGFAVKLVMTGTGPVGTFAGVYRGLISTTSNADAGTRLQRAEIVIVPAIVGIAADVHRTAVVGHDHAVLFQSRQNHLRLRREPGNIVGSLQPHAHAHGRGVSDCVEFAAQCDAGGVNAVWLFCSVKRSAWWIAPLATSS